MYKGGRSPLEIRLPFSDIFQGQTHTSKKAKLVCRHRKELVCLLLVAPLATRDTCSVRYGAHARLHPLHSFFASTCSQSIDLFGLPIFGRSITTSHFWAAGINCYIATALTSPPAAVWYIVCRENIADWFH
jgi:hypothetical protein